MFIIFTSTATRGHSCKSHFFFLPLCDLYSGVTYSQENTINTFCLHSDCLVTPGSFAPLSFPVNAIFNKSSNTKNKHKNIWCLILEQSIEFTTLIHFTPCHFVFHSGANGSPLSVLSALFSPSTFISNVFVNVTDVPVWFKTVGLRARRMAKDFESWWVQMCVGPPCWVSGTGM